MDDYSNIGLRCRNSFDTIADSIIESVITDRVSVKSLPITLRKMLLYKKATGEAHTNGQIDRHLHSQEDNILDFINSHLEQKTIPITLRKYMMCQMLKTG